MGSSDAGLQAVILQTKTQEMLVWFFFSFPSNITLLLKSYTKTRGEDKLKKTCNKKTTRAKSTLGFISTQKKNKLQCREEQTLGRVTTCRQKGSDIWTNLLEQRSSPDKHFLLPNIFPLTRHFPLWKHNLFTTFQVNVMWQWAPNISLWDYQKLPHNRSLQGLHQHWAHP